MAVKDVWFGVNGAGKTTLACLTDERLIHGYSITRQYTIQRFIRYCPQFDALFESLTGEEHLRFYGTLKGLKDDELDERIERY